MKTISTAFIILLFATTAFAKINVTADINGFLSFTKDRIPGIASLPESEIIEEWSGKLKIEGETVFYIEPWKKIAVGAISNSKVNLCSGDYRKICSLNFGTKYPEYKTPENTTGDSGLPVESMNITFTASEEESGQYDSYKEMVKYILTSPDQQDAGSCLYMATTGAAEIHLNKSALSNGTSPAQLKHDGPTDLSERYTMNISEWMSSGAELKNWRTDNIYLFNFGKGGLLNRDYRYTKGWYKEVGDQANGEPKLIKSKEGEEGARYSTYYNWLSELTPELMAKKITLPQFDRNVIFADPEENQWNVGLLGNDTIAKIKETLKRTGNPILIIYNHYTYWHAVLIVGYDDSKEIKGCPFVEKWREYVPKRIAILRKAGTPEDIKRADKYQLLVDKLEKAYAENGGCKSAKGVFLVRDSIYAGPESDKYDYDQSKTGEEAPYGAPVVEHEYDWVRYLGNHLSEITVK